jgi:hypothetical protein
MRQPADRAGGPEFGLASLMAGVPQGPFAIFEGLLQRKMT